ncbi:helix-turn-helix domain-containing protein [Endozoicomonadaceae bacterium StTr2]
MKTIEIISLPQAEHAHCHSHHQIVIALEGLADFEIEGRSGRVTPGQGCILQAMTHHAFAGQNNNQLMLLNIDERSSAIEQELLNRSGWFRVDANLTRLISVASTELQQFPEDGLLEDALFSSMLRSLALRDRQSRLRSEKKVFDLELLQEYIRANLERSLPVSELAAMSCMSASRLHEVFRERIGKTPHQYIIAQRLDQARRLLVETVDPVSEIAHRCGFSSQSALSHAMKKYLGITPLSYRKQNTGAERMYQGAIH